VNRSGLGKGLAALLPDSAGPAARQVAQIPIASIRPNPHQPRTVFDEEKLDELAQSLREHGLMQPVTLRPAPEGEGYQIVAGERRWRAAQRAGFEQIPALITPCNERQMLELALVENLQREDIGPMEAAEAYQRCLEDFGLTQEELAQRIGKSRAAVANTLRLLKLAEPVQRMLAAGTLSEGHGRALLAVVDGEQQVKLARRVVADSLSVRETERLARSERIRGISEPAPGGNRSERVAQPLDPDLADFAERLQRRLGTKVDLRTSPDGGGSIVIRWYEDEDLLRIAEILDA